MFLLEVTGTNLASFRQKSMGLQQLNMPRLFGAALIVLGGCNYKGTTNQCCFFGLPSDNETWQWKSIIYDGFPINSELSLATFDHPGYILITKIWQS